MKTIIVIPTYNERDNIEVVLKQIFDVSLSDLWVVVVDDNSPDGTGHHVEQLKSRYSKLQVIHRQGKLGLGTAYVAGFQEALRAGADYILEMDADLSHDPRYLPEILRQAQSFDLVLGSRYVSGGGVKNWNFFRRCISRFGNFYAQIILSVPIKDLTGGFKCYKRKVLEAIDLGSLSSVGYNFQIETTYKAYKQGFRIKEIPIVFAEREEGKSKFSIIIILESFWKVIILRLFS